MASALPSLGATMAGGAFAAAYAATRRDRQRRERAAAERGPKQRVGVNKRYPLTHSSQPASSLTDTITYSQVGMKNITLVKDFVDIRGTRCWMYYLPGMKVLLFVVPGLMSDQNRIQPSKATSLSALITPNRKKRHFWKSTPYQTRADITPEIRKLSNQAMGRKRKGLDVTDEQRIAYNISCYCSRVKTPQRLLKDYKANAARKHLPFLLEDDFCLWLFKQPCNYCGELPKKEKPTGIDRFDSNVTYVPCNVVPCCSVCNVMKLDLTEDAFMTKIRQICIHKEVKL